MDREYWAWQVLRPLLDGRPYLPWTEGALRPSVLVTLLNEIALGRRQAIVELGSGASTVVIGRLLAERGGNLTSVEHDPSWATIVREQLEREGLEGVVQLLAAPFEAHSASWAGAPWYSADTIASLPGAIDLLLVDGPPGHGEGMSHSRYPALPALASRLLTDAVVVLDDADREPEREIVERWQKELPEWRFGIDAEIGVAIGRRG